VEDRPVRPDRDVDQVRREAYRIREKGKAGIVVPSKDKLPTIINTLIEAVRAGELDDQATTRVQKEGGGKVLSSRTRRSSSRAAVLLRLAATTIGRSDTALGGFYRRLSSAGSSATFSVAAGQAADSNNGDMLALSAAISKTALLVDFARLGGGLGTRAGL
jgi:hypothetical protein